MTPTEALQRVERIRAAAGDDEGAHGMEDALRAEVLEHISKGGRNAKVLASIALSTDQINFARWCA